MTKEEILEYFKDINGAYNECTRYDTLKRMLDELEPTCEDAVSREQVLGIVNNPMNIFLDLIIGDLPSVRPIRPKGEWEVCEDDDGMYGICSCCGKDSDFAHDGKAYDYCPNCGAKMRGME